MEERYALDNGICQVVECWAEGSTPHHVVLKKSGGTTHCYTIDEMVTLCVWHHSKLHRNADTLDLKDGRRIDLWGVVT
jgi:hypothetical protein